MTVHPFIKFKQQYGLESDPEHLDCETTIALDFWNAALELAQKEISVITDETVAKTNQKIYKRLTNCMMTPLPKKEKKCFLCR